MGLLGVSRSPEMENLPEMVMTVTVCELENGPVEIVDLPSYNMVIFSSYATVYQRVPITFETFDVTYGVAHFLLSQSLVDYIDTWLIGFQQGTKGFNSTIGNMPKQHYRE
jgi:hypothetical protein